MTMQAPSAGSGSAPIRTSIWDELYQRADAVIEQGQNTAHRAEQLRAKILGAANPPSEPPNKEPSVLGFKDVLMDKLQKMMDLFNLISEDLDHLD